MVARNKKINKTTGLYVFKFELIAKDCNFSQKDYQSWGLTPTEGKRHIMYLTDTFSKINDFIMQLKLNEVTFTYEDITNSILLMMNIDPLFRRAYDYNESFKWSIDKIRIDRLTQDDILDKINEYGKNSLDHIDLKLLKSF